MILFVLRHLQGNYIITCRGVLMWCTGTVSSLSSRLAPLKSIQLMSLHSVLHWLRPAWITDCLLLFSSTRFIENALTLLCFLWRKQNHTRIVVSPDGAPDRHSLPYFLSSFLASPLASSSFSHQLNSLHKCFVSRTPGVYYQRRFWFNICHA